VTGVSFGIDANHSGNVGALNEDAVEQMLPQVIEFVGGNSSLNPDCLIVLLTHNSVEHFGEPPNT